MQLARRRSNSKKSAPPSPHSSTLMALAAPSPLPRRSLCSSYAATFASRSLLPSPLASHSLAADCSILRWLALARCTLCPSVTTFPPLHSYHCHCYAILLRFRSLNTPLTAACSLYVTTLAYSCPASTLLPLRRAASLLRRCASAAPPLLTSSHQAVTPGSCCGRAVVRKAED